MSDLCRTLTAFRLSQIGPTVSAQVNELVKVEAVGGGRAPLFEVLACGVDEGGELPVLVDSGLECGEVRGWR